MNRTERLAHAIETFKSLGLDNWELASQSIPQGGQSGVCAVKRTDGKKGVFRCPPPSPAAQAVARFRKEIEAISIISHPNVMTLLEYGETDPFWYITPLGENFKSYWRGVTATLNRVEIETFALRIVRSLAQGLGACHQVGVVHRDVKPSNIVILHAGNEPHPVLIDFGVVWFPEGDRLTEEGEAIGNARYSPDMLRKRADECPPWVDVFQLVQVFQWMIAERDAKHYWQRPIHWKYIEFPEDSSPDFCDSLRAVGAATSTQETSPKDGDALASFLDVLFPTSLRDSDTAPPVHEDGMARATAAGLTRKITREVLDKEVVEGAHESAGIIYTQLRDRLASLGNAPQISIENCRKFNDLFRAEQYRGTEEELLGFNCAVADSSCFRVSVRITAFVPSRWPQGVKPKSLADTNVFACAIYRTGPSNSITHQPFPAEKLLISIRNDGRLSRHDPSWSDSPVYISIEEIRELVRAMLQDPKAWEFVAEF